VKINIPAILPKSLLKIAATASLAVGCLLMVHCDGDSSSNSNLSPPVSEQGLAPGSLNGITISLDDSGELLAIAENGDTWFLIEEPPVDGITGTFTYNASGNTATLNAINGNAATVVLEFNSESTGTYVISGNEQSESGSFTLIDTNQLTAPSSIAGLTIDYLLVSSSVDVGPGRRATEIFAEDGVTSIGFGDDGSIQKSSFTYSAKGNIGYFGNVQVQVFEFEGGPLVEKFGGEFLLTFLTETTGIYQLTRSGLFQTGIFEVIDGL